MRGLALEATVVDWWADTLSWMIEGARKVCASKNSGQQIGVHGINRIDDIRKTSGKMHQDPFHRHHSERRKAWSDSPVRGIRHHWEGLFIPLTKSG